MGVRFGLLPFRSPLLGESLLVSPPAGTKMFPFPAFPPPTGYLSLFGPGGKPHSGIPGSTPACGYPGHIAACRALPRRPSRAIHRAASWHGWRVSAPAWWLREEAPLNPNPLKEVIRPQVPLRPPCYDFAPLGDPQLDPPVNPGGLVKDPLGWRDGRCVQGAGTYSPRVGDTRLLGIPRSRGRVAALDSYWGGVYGIASPFRGRIPLSPPLQLACSPGVSGHTDLP